jgi:hypothetical protein
MRAFLRFSLSAGLVALAAACGSTGDTSSTHSSTTGTRGGTGGTGGATTVSGHEGSELVSGGQQIKSASYRMVCTLGQPSPVQEKIVSASYAIRGGLIAATGSTP